LVVETGDAREVHHFALLTAYGAGAINPYLAFETIQQMQTMNGGDQARILEGCNSARRASCRSRSTCIVWALEDRSACTEMT
jgi:glutamate synthase (NADPH/NADH) large chain